MLFLQFVDKKKAMRSSGYSERDVTESYGYLYSETEDQVYIWSLLIYCLRCPWCLPVQKLSVLGYQ